MQLKTNKYLETVTLDFNCYGILGYICFIVNPNQEYDLRIGYFSQASQNRAAGSIWPVGRTLPGPTWVGLPQKVDSQVTD